MHGFELIDKQDLAVYKSTASLYRHSKTGAELLSIENDDTNKVFGITFRTPPADSTGIAHILEHSVLCGSKKYPVKEPFVELLKGSLQTFLNAFTYPDKTCYPVASENLQDFYNLIDVYFDAVFYPRITPEILEQEGWHYELEKPEGPLSYRGVVYNEMKGVYSSPDSLLMEYTQQQVFPDSIYGLDSGGHPSCIPDLSYEQFKAFHSNYYHPSNARIFFSGDDPVEKRLELAAACLDAFEKKAPSPAIALQPRWKSPRSIIKRYAAAEGAEDAFYTMSWLLEETSSIETNLALTILEYILLGMSGSPLKKALIDSGLGTDIAGAGLENELRQMYFSTGLKGIKEEKAPEVQALILNTLKELAAAPLAADLVEAALNTIEFQLRENNSGRFPRGLVLMLRALTTWLYDKNPMLMLDFEKPLAAVRTALDANPMFFSELIQQHFLDNPHRSEVLLLPDAALGQQSMDQENAKLETVLSAMSQEQKERTIKHTEELHRMQEAADAPEDLAKIPRLRVSDMEKKIRITPEEQRETDGALVYVHPLSTNGIIYTDLAFSLEGISFSELPMARLLGSLISGMGTTREDFATLSMRISRETGGIRTSAVSFAAKEGSSHPAFLIMRGKATSANLDKLTGIMQELLTMPDFSSRERCKQIILKQKASVEAKLIPNGHSFVTSRLFASRHTAGAMADAMNGIGYLLFLRELASRIDTDWANIKEMIHRVFVAVINRRGLTINLTADPDAVEAAFRSLSALAASLPDHAVHPSALTQSYSPAHEALLLPSQINYVGQACSLDRAGYSFHGSINVIRRYLRASFLWDQVRVQGGAYGAFCQYDRYGGVFTLCSYRDPHIKRTLDVYASIPAHLESLSLNADELEKSIIGSIGEQDACELPDAQGFTAFIRRLRGVTDIERQQSRDEILSTSIEHFNQLGSILARAFSDTSTVVISDPKQAPVIEGLVKGAVSRLELG